MPVRVSFHFNGLPVLKSDAQWMAHITQSVDAAVREFAAEVTNCLPSDVRLFVDVLLSQRDNNDFETVPLGSRIGRITNPAAPITATVRYLARDLKGLSAADIATMVKADCGGILVEVVQNVSA